MNSQHIPLLQRNTQKTFLFENQDSIEEQKDLQEHQQFKQQYNDYDPFKIPPSVALAEMHKQAMKVGIRSKDNYEICPCCNMWVKKTKISLCCNESKLSFLGCGFSFYFFYLKMSILMISLTFFFGGAFNLLILNLNCQDNCVTFFGLRLLNLDNIEHQLNLQSWNNTFVCIFILFIINMIKKNMFNVMKKFNDEIVNISSYSIMVRNLDQSTTKQEIKELFENLTKYDVLDINLCFNISEFQNLFQRKKEIQKKIFKSELELMRLENKKRDCYFQNINVENQILTLSETIQKLLDQMKEEKSNLEESMKNFERDCQTEPSN